MEKVGNRGFSFSRLLPLLRAPEKKSSNNDSKKRRKSRKRIENVDFQLRKYEQTDEINLRNDRAAIERCKQTVKAIKRDCSVENKS